MTLRNFLKNYDGSGVELYIELEEKWAMLIYEEYKEKYKAAAIDKEIDYWITMEFLKDKNIVPEILYTDILKKSNLYMELAASDNAEMIGTIEKTLNSMIIEKER